VSGPWAGPPRATDGGTFDVAVVRHEHGQLGQAHDEVAVEEPFELQVSGQSVALIMRTPGDDPFLAAGFLLSEGIAQSADDFLAFAPGSDRDGFPQSNVLNVRLRPEVEAIGTLNRRNFPISASCGLCGAASIEAAQLRARPVRLGAVVSSEVLLGLAAKLRAAQAVFNRTGGIHAAGLFDLQGGLIVVHEDVGRHNAVDKVVGQMLLERRLPLAGSLLLVSGRASFELVQKAAVAGIPILAAVGAPSSLAVEMALASQMTLIGMLRPGRFVVYTWPERIRPSLGHPSAFSP
jgi:FdhD protein